MSFSHFTKSQSKQNQSSVRFGVLFHSKTLYTCSLFFFLVLFSSCTSRIEINQPSPAINKIKSGEKFFINLPENHAEYFTWRLSDDHNKNLIEDINSVWHGNEKGVIYHFTAKKPGVDTLKFTQYKYNEVSKNTSFIVKVE